MLKVQIYFEKSRFEDSNQIQVKQCLTQIACRCWYLTVTPDILEHSQVYDMERRQAAAAEREAGKAARLALMERQERERSTKLKMEEEAYEMQLQVTCPSPHRPSYSLFLQGGWEGELCCKPSERKHKRQMKAILLDQCAAQTMTHCCTLHGMLQHLSVFTDHD